ncbi:hypothetical protein OCU04_001044 [Sclerotinia nivalis]|uniref:Uncharacterized protein n=1 Tax=Sclerotinia nivalis TaxID=352851 RepID=A0A9X0AYH2_9HELO|nr:hypothetical protein OCU04_001044 [Sclerotinia nivalis]
MVDGTASNNNSWVTISNDSPEQFSSVAPSYHSNYSAELVLTLPPANAQANGRSSQGSIQSKFNPPPRYSVTDQ